MRSRQVSAVARCRVEGAEWEGQRIERAAEDGRSQEHEVNRLEPLGHHPKPGGGFLRGERPLQPQPVDGPVTLNGNQLARDEHVVRLKRLQSPRFAKNQPDER